MTKEAEIALVAAKLTKAQRKVLAAIGDEPALPGLKTFSANAAFNLIRRRVTRIVFDRKLLRDRYELTDHGKAVRAHLERAQGEDTGDAR